MRKDLGARSILYPMPVFIIGTYNEDGTPNAMNAAWGGMSEDKQISICVDDGHKTAENVAKRGAFTVSMATADTLVPCDYVGIASGNKVPDKVQKAGLTAEPAAHVDAPLFAQLPMALECKVIEYNKETCRLLGEIVNVCADPSILNEAGNIDPAKLRPITYDPMNNTYLVLGETVGNAFRDGLALK